MKMSSCATLIPHDHPSISGLKTAKMKNSSDSTNHREVEDRDWWRHLGEESRNPLEGGEGGRPQTRGPASCEGLKAPQRLSPFEWFRNAGQLQRKHRSNPNAEFAPVQFRALRLKGTADNGNTFGKKNPPLSVSPRFDKPSTRNDSNGSDLLLTAQ